MPKTQSSTRGSLLLIHDDSSLLDALTRVLEVRGFQVTVADTLFAACSRLASGAKFHAIIASFDNVQGIGKRAYQWALSHRYELRGRFIFVSTDVPRNFDDIVQGRCLLVYSYDFDELIRLTESMVKRSLTGDDSGLPRNDLDDKSKPSLLLVDDEPLQLSVMQTLLADIGFSVTAANSGKAAKSALQSGDFDVILSDWYMPHCSGGDLYEWLVRNRPTMASRCVFMSAASPEDEVGRRAPGCPFVHKGQDSPVLVSHLKSIATKTRDYTIAVPARA